MTKIIPNVRRMEASDIEEAAEVHKRAFPRQTHSKEWLECALQAFPKSQCFIAELDGKIVGVIFYTEKSGFRPEAFVDLEQECIDPPYQGKGIGTALIAQSLPMVAEEIAKQRGAILKTLSVNTREDNTAAMRLYKKFGAEPVARMPGVFTADEIFLVARDVDKALLGK